MNRLSTLISHPFNISEDMSSRYLIWIRKAVYLFLLYNMLIMTISNAEIYWGEGSLMRAWDWDGSILFKFQYLMMNDWMNNLYVVLLILHLGALFFGVLKKGNRFIHITIFITTLWLYGRLYLYVIGGNQLIQMMLFYLIFAEEHSQQILQLKINKWVLLACQLQICFVYFFSGLYKLAGDDWVNGKAMYYILSIEEYSHPWVISHIINLKWLTVLMTYSALLYQLTFPILIWINGIKKPLLIIGVIFHLFIGIVMGIWDFALVMIAVYAAFWPRKLD